MEFAPRPPLRPEMVRAAAPRRASAPAKQAAPPVAAPAKPAPAPKPRRATRQSSPPFVKTDKRFGDTTFETVVAMLEQRRTQIDAVIVGLRKIKEWWP